MKKGISALALAAVLAGCAAHSKIERLSRSHVSAGLSVAEDNYVPELDMSELYRDTITVIDPEGKEEIIMRAVKDEDGEMVATDVISAAKVTARFRNIAERHGQVELSFNISVPEEMMDSGWQLRFRPDLTLNGRTEPLDLILITGANYRKAQLRGYEQYAKFLASIVRDSARFLLYNQLELFLKRNLPEIYKFKTDSSLVADDAITSLYGVTERQAVAHYTNRFLVRRNAWKVAHKGAVFDRYVKVPLVREGLRLDTVLHTPDKEFVYRYVQTIRTLPKLKKADITLTGAIYEEDRRIYTVPKTEPLSFYISSLSTLTDRRERYLTRIVSRRAEAHTACYIDFQVGKAEIDLSLGHNPTEIDRIEQNLRDIVGNRIYDLDSIIVTASCSPEGGYEYNRRLSLARANAVSAYFSKRLLALRDSVEREKGTVYDLAGELETSRKREEIRFTYKNRPENWEMLDRLVERDSSLSSTDKAGYFSLSGTADPDEREKRMQRQPCYRYLRETLYPRTRTVQFGFHLHRKGMLKDTVHTTLIDTLYMAGLQALDDRDYEKAVRILRPYNDFNAAVALCAMDYNASAEAVLQRLRPDDKIRYMLAIIYSRKGEEQKAVQYYIDACHSNRAFINRGNLDPEISVLIRKYGLHDHI